MRWQVEQGLEATGARRVVFKVVGGDVELLEELDGDAVVAAFGEVPGAHEVSSADVKANVHLLGMLGDAVVVRLDIGIQKLVRSLLI